MLRSSVRAHHAHAGGLAPPEKVDAAAAAADYWPQAFDDLFGFVFATPSKDAFWSHGYADILSGLTAPRDTEAFAKQPVRTVAEACDRIFQLTGLRRGPSQVRKFLKDLGLKFQRVRMVPVPPKKTWPSTSTSRPSFSKPT